MIALITGITGFVGSHLARRLVQDGWQVHGVVRPGSSPSAIADLGAAVQMHVQDGSFAQVEAVVRCAAPDVVFHLASYFTAEHRSAEIDAVIDANIRFGTLLLEAMACHQVRCMVNTGTAWQHYQDADYNPVCLYAASKQAFATLLRYYQEAHGIRSVTLKLHDTYGPGDRRAKLFNLLRRQDSAEPLAMSAGEQKLDLVYIDDVVTAFVSAAERALSGMQGPAEEFVVTSGDRLRLREAVDLYLRITGRPLQIDWGNRPYRRREVMEPWTQGRMLPGWKARVDLAEGIRRMEAIDGRRPHAGEAQAR
jgi:nucleoside-diphosphate-sugar epimerase